MNDQIRFAVDALPGLVWSSRPDGFVDFLNLRWLEYTGLPLEQAIGWGWQAAIFPDDIEGLLRTWSEMLASGAPGEAEARLRRFDGQYRWFLFRAMPLRGEDGEIVKWYGQTTDIEDRKQADELLAGEKRLLEMIAQATPLQQTLDALCRSVEAILRDSWVSVLLLDLKAQRLTHGAGPSLPQSYTREIDGSQVDPTIGPCAAAAHWGKQVIVPDLASETRWPKVRALASTHGIRACWSTPIKSSDARVLGTFAIYWREPGVPTAQQRRQLEQFTHLASIAIERDGATEALKRSEERYALAMQASGDGHWDWDMPRDRFYASPLLLQICGLPPSSTFASQAEFRERLPFHPDDRSTWEKELEAYFAGSSPRLETEMRIVRNGETRWIHMTGLCLRDRDGVPVRFAGSVTDVTERKHVEEELRARQEMLDLAQKAARAVAFEWRIGAAEGCNRWSPDLETMYGLEPGTYDGSYETWKKLLHPDDWPSVRAAIKHAHQTGDVAAEYRVLRRDGAARWLQAKGRMFFDSEGSPSRMIGFMLDVTERRIAEEELEKMEGQLRRSHRLEAMGTLAGGIAHDFNNLLGAILGYGEMALRGARAGSRLRRDIESIMIAGERGRALVDRILAFSRSGIGERIPVNVQKIVRETLSLIGAKPPAGIRIEHRLRGGRSAVLGDPTQIHQVLMNLVTNALHAMPSGGALRISLDRVQLDSPRTATVGTLAAADYVVLKVSDTGTGIPPQIQERIFDPFFTTKDVRVGTGLGLPLVHGIATGLGGAIDVASTVGKGSVFTVYLPRFGEAPPEDERPNAEPAARVRRGNRERILVVDDEAPLVDLLTQTLTGLGYAPVGFTSSSAALAAFNANPQQFDAVMTDESMPGESGSELISRMRQVRPHLPILLVSGYVGGAVVQRAREAGADEVLKKPLTARELALTLARVLSPAKRQRRQPAR
jgi:PAS domain S-box-containing protein